MRFPQVSGYRLLEKIGEGEFRDVYRVWKVLEFGNRSKEGDRTDIYPCALKVYKNPRHINTGLEELRIRRDSLKGGQGSEGIEQVYNFGSLDGGLFVETELIDGYPILKKQFEDVEGKRKCVGSVFTRNFSFVETVKIGIKIAKALEYLHSRGYVARDLSLANIMVNDDLSVVKICDIDHIKRIGDTVKPESRPDGVTKIVGQEYMNFDMLERSDLALDESTDLYALGCCMLYMLSRREHKIEASSPEEFREKQRKLAEDIDFGNVPEHLKNGMKKVLVEVLGLDGKTAMPVNASEFLNKIEPINRDLSLIYRYSGMPVIARCGRGRDLFVYGLVRSVDYHRGVRTADMKKLVFEKLVVLEAIPDVRFFADSPQPTSILDPTIDEIKSNKGKSFKSRKDPNLLVADYSLEGYRATIETQHPSQGRLMYNTCYIGHETGELPGHGKGPLFFHIFEREFFEGPISFRFDDSAEMLHLFRDHDLDKEIEGSEESALEECEGGFMKYLKTSEKLRESAMAKLRSRGKWVRINELLEASE